MLRPHLPHRRVLWLPCWAGACCARAVRVLCGRVLCAQVWSSLSKYAGAHGLTPPKPEKPWKPANVKPEEWDTPAVHAALKEASLPHTVRLARPRAPHDRRRHVRLTGEVARSGRVAVQATRSSSSSARGGGESAAAVEAR